MNYLTYISILFVGTGYLTSCFGKLNSGWLVRDNLVIYGYILDFNKGIGLPTLMGDMLLTFKNKVFWKAIDYSVLIFQFSYLLVFYDKRFFFYLTPLSILFHIGILFTLGIGVFYLYILFYALIYIWISPSVLSNKQGFLKQNILSTKVFKGIVMGVLMLLFILSGFDAHFFNQLLPLEIYQYNEYAYNFICIVLFLIISFQIKQNNKTTQLKKSYGT